MFFLASLVTLVTSANLSLDDATKVKSVHMAGAPNLAKLLERSIVDSKSVYDDIRNSPLATIVPVMATPNTPPTRKVVADAALPVVVGHGMGDSCFNPGMKQITSEIGKRVNAYAACIPTGNNDIEDTINGFLMSVDKSIDVFAAKIRNDTNFKDGFNVFSLSQSGLIVRGHIQKYNDPPVKTWLAGWPVAMGVAALPHCPPSGPLVGPLCAAVTEALGAIAYDKPIQEVLFQAGMFRDPLSQHNQLQSKLNACKPQQPWHNAAP
jgi:palmitoyl-protein thioesterase